MIETNVIPLHHRLSTPRAAGLAGILVGGLFITSHALILVSFEISPWIALIFPAWMVMVSSLILISNYRRKTTGEWRRLSTDFANETITS